MHTYICIHLSGVQSLGVLLLFRGRREGRRRHQEHRGPALPTSCVKVNSPTKLSTWNLVNVNSPTKRISDQKHLDACRVMKLSVGGTKGVDATRSTEAPLCPPP